MRTTIRLDDDLLVEVKQIAARSDKTLTSVIEDALREMLARQRETTERTPVKLTTVSGGGLQPGVDLDDSAALLSLMEEFSDPA
jgi:K+-transporting ATPase c subunit